MTHYVILSSVEATANCFENILRCIYKVSPDELIKSIVVPQCKGRALDAFEFVAAEIDGFLSAFDCAHDRVIGILDLPEWMAPSEIPSLSSYQGMAILTYPEIGWVPIFRNVGEHIDGSRKNDEIDLTRAIKLAEGGYTPLFDGDGLRSVLLKRVHRNSAFSRYDIALAIDEESNFAFMNAYAAYRFGYRGIVVKSGCVAEDLLTRGRRKEKGSNVLSVRNGHLEECLLEEKYRESGCPSVIAFEDVCLQYPDKNRNYVLDREFGGSRDKNFRLLRDCDLRVVATAAQDDEKCAKLNGERLTIAEYLEGCGSCQRLGRGRLQSRTRLLSRIGRMLFNEFHGAWLGYWGVNLLVSLIVVYVLLQVFFSSPTWLVPGVLLLALAVGVLGYVNRLVLNRLLVGMPIVGRYFLRRSQWRFLPRMYRHHYPERAIHQHDGTYWQIIHKPLTGIFGVRNACDLPSGRGYRGLERRKDVLEIYRNARRWCNFNLPTGIAEDGVGHAAAGVAMLLASRLIRRAKSMETAGLVSDVEGAIHAAVLANTACELLNYKTPAMSIEALSLKHYFEVMAECEFVGVQASVNMSDRYTDMFNAMRRICASEDGLVREQVFISGLAQLSDKLSALLLSSGKREEALYFIRKSRYLHRRLLNPIARSFLAYPEWVMRSPVNFAISFFGFFAVFWMFWWAKVEPGLTVWHALARTYEVLLANQPNMAPSTVQDVVRTMIHVMRQVALLHLAFLGANFWDFMHRK